MPILNFKTQDEIPEGLREGAKQNDGGEGFSVNVVLNSKLEEFRNSNVSLSKERDSYKTQVERFAPIIGEDLEGFAAQVETWKSTAQQVADGKLKGSDAVEKEVEKRTTAMRDDFQRQLSDEAKKRVAAEAAAEAAEGRYKNSLIDRAVTDAVLSEKSGAEPAALPDILNRAKSVFVIDNEGKIIPKDGEAIIYGADGSTPMTPAEWLGGLKEKAPHFFKSSTGGGGGGGDGKGGKIHGMSAADFAKLPARKRLELANKS